MTIDSRDSTPDDAARWDTLARYLSGESSPAEEVRVRAWLAADPRHGELLAAIERALHTATPPAAEDIDVEAALQRVSARIDASDVRSIDDARARRRPANGWLRAAVIAALLLGGALVWRMAGTDPSPESTVAAARTFTAPIGAVDSLLLADGTRVLLAPGSRLEVRAGYGTDTRVVELDGEAWFDVSRQSAGLFTVRAGDAVIRDLGTTFTVRAGADGLVRVVVTAGSVELRAASGPDSAAILRVGDRAELRDGRIATERGGASDDDVAWTTGRLVFNDVTLAHVAAELLRWYGVRLEFAEPSLAARRVTASFQGEAVQQVLDVIGLAVGLDIERRGNIAVVRRVP